MKRIIMITGLTLQLSVCAWPQPGDWHAVQALPGGTKIKVQLIRGRTFNNCLLDGVTDNQLTCTFGGRYWFRQETFPRSNIKAVFRARNGVLIGAGVGAAAGAAIGASRDTCCRGAHAFFGAAIGSALGAVAGTAADPFLHGKAVYRSRTSSQPAPSKNPTGYAGSTVRDVTDSEPKIPCLRDGVTLKCVDQER